MLMIIATVMATHCPLHDPSPLLCDSASDTATKKGITLIHKKRLERDPPTGNTAIKGCSSSKLRHL
jgi:hypothetical protein